MKTLHRNLFEDKINLDIEKSWQIIDRQKAKGYVRKHWGGKHYAVIFPTMEITYHKWERLDSNKKVDISTYDYTNGKAIFTSYSLNLIKEWEQENQNEIQIDYSDTENINY